MADLAGQAGNAAVNEAIAKAGVGPFYWSTIWIPYISYLWTMAWIGEKFIKRAIGKEDSSISLFDRWEKVFMVLADFLWFFLTAIFIAIVAQAICNGAGIGKTAALVARAAVKIQSFGQVNFDFCQDVPEIQF